MTTFGTLVAKAPAINAFVVNFCSRLASDRAIVPQIDQLRSWVWKCVMSTDHMMAIVIKSNKIWNSNRATLCRGKPKTDFFFGKNKNRVGNAEINTAPNYISDPYLFSKHLHLWIDYLIPAELFLGSDVSVTWSSPTINLFQPCIYSYSFRLPHVKLTNVLSFTSQLGCFILELPSIIIGKFPT